MLADGKRLAADAQLVGAPSVLFDAVAIIVDHDAATVLAKEAAAIDFVRDAFGHLKAIGVDAGVVNASDSAAFIAAAKTRQWEREASVRTLA